MRLLFDRLSPRGPRARLQIFIFHRVLPRQDPLFPQEVWLQRFDQMCSWIGRWFNVLPLDEAVRRLRGGNLPSAAAAITFDDGYRDNHDVALPVLQRHGFSATFFVATGFLNGGRMWNDTLIETIRGLEASSIDLDDLGRQERVDVQAPAARRQAIQIAIDAVKYLEPPERLQRVGRFARRYAKTLPSDLMMCDDHVRALRAQGMLLGGHTVDHPILARLDPDAAEAEIARGRQRLEALIDERVALFAYPNGKPGTDYVPQHVDMVRRMGFDAAVSTAWAVAGAGSDVHELPRFTPWDEGRVKFGLRLAKTMWRSPIAP